MRANGLQRTAESRGGCNRRASWPPSLSLSRSAMRTSQFILLQVAVLLLSLLKSYGGEKIDEFNTLPAGDTLEMRFSSGGCFHFYTYDLTFSNSTVRTNLRKLQLSPSDLAGLDTLIAFYRTNKYADCTTQNTIKISQLRDGKVIATEEFKDASCRSRKIKGVLTIPGLVARLENGASK